MNNMEKIKFLVGNKEIKKISLSPYDKEVLDFLVDLSEDLNLTKDIKNYPDIKTFAFFCRNKNLIKLKKNFLVSSRDIRLGLGLIFHITPSNIPTNFAYSFFFGLLSGNSNIVKVPSINFKEKEIILTILKSVLNKSKYIDLKKTNSFIQYNTKAETTKIISSICDGRVIWGGDKTINEIRKIWIPERSVEITFPDRYSISIINSDQLKKVKFSKIQQLAKKFYIDGYSMNQAACNS